MVIMAEQVPVVINSQAQSTWVLPTSDTVDRVPDKQKNANICAELVAYGRPGTWAPLIGSWYTSTLPEQVPVHDSQAQSTLPRKHQSMASLSVRQAVSTQPGGEPT